MIITIALQMSKKMPDGTIYVIGGNTVPEFEENLTGVFRDPKDVEDILTSMAAAFFGPPTLATVTSILPGTVEESWETAAPAPAGRRASAGPPPGQNLATAYVAAAQAAPPAPGRTCPHGVMVQRSGGGGNTGKQAWTGHFCPLEKGHPQQCAPQFVR